MGFIGEIPERADINRVSKSPDHEGDLWAKCRDDRSTEQSGQEEYRVEDRIGTIHHFRLIGRSSTGTKERDSDIDPRTQAHDGSGNNILAERVNQSRRPHIHGDRYMFKRRQWTL